jgi:phosphoribosylglycinamide formyltransferase-1
LVSGSGTILEAIVDAGIDIALVASDRPCRGLEVARGAGIEALLVDRTAFGGFAKSFDREGYSAELASVLKAHDIDLVAMAGFGTIMTAVFHEAFPGRVLNTHPSLLPDFKGWHAVAQAMEAGVKESGCTVHVATEELDNGPILAQRRVAVLEGDDEAALHERIKTVERSLYPLVLSRVMASLDEGLEPVSVAGTLEEK